MKELSRFDQLFIKLEPVDFRKRAYGLCAIIQEAEGLKILGTNILYGFTNKRRDAVALLYWDGTGLALWQKKLEKDRFKWPRTNSEAMKELSCEEVKWLLEGIDITRIKKHKDLHFPLTLEA